MAKRKRRRVNHTPSLRFALLSLLLVGIALTGVVSISAKTRAQTLAVHDSYEGPPLSPNLFVKAQVIEFFEANDAPEMIPIIKCESNFNHFDEDGEVLKNRAGSSAIGVAQILTSKHPDQKVLAKFNREHNTALTAPDFDLTTLMGNLGYALVLYQVRGTRDWECAH
jgi:hypothetical protein